MNSIQFNAPAASFSAAPIPQGGTAQLESLALRHLASSSLAWVQPTATPPQVDSARSVPAPPSASAPNMVGPSPAAPPVNLLVLDSFVLSLEELAAGKTQSHGEQTTHVASNAIQSDQVQVLTAEAQNLWRFIDQLNAIAASPNPPKVINISLGLSPATAFASDFPHFNSRFESKYGADKNQWSDETWDLYLQDISIMAQTAVDATNQQVGIFPQDLQDSLEKLVDAGVTVTVAAGNDGHVESLFTDLGLSVPAGFYDGIYLPDMPEGVIFVGASQDNSIPTSPAISSSPNSQTDVIADGTDVAVADGGVLAEGSSFAAPQVAALVADMLAANPELTPARIEAILKATAVSVDGVPGKVGSGLINRQNALAMAGGQPIKETLVEQVTRYFDGWDAAAPDSAKDGLVSMADIQTVANDVSLSADERAAAQQLVDSPDFFDSWERAMSGAWDGLLSVKDMLIWDAREKGPADLAFASADVAQTDFYLFDTASVAARDGLFNRDDARRIINDDVSTDRMKQAAQYLVEQSDLFDQLDAAQNGKNGKLDGHVSFKDISIWQLDHANA